ncbi:MAG: hypothetical protein ACSHX7_13160 [Luteolibacter sp.]
MKNKITYGVCLVIAASSLAHGAVTFYDDETAFQADLVNAADFGAGDFDADAAASPFGSSDSSDLVSATWTTTISGDDYTVTFSEGVFDTSIGGTATVATGPASLSDIDFTDSDFIYEAGETDQGGATIPTWGFDTEFSPSGGNAAAVFDFTASATDVFSFSLLLADFEGGNAWSNVVSAFRADGSLIGSISFDFPGPEYGDAVLNFVGFGADEALGYVAFFVGEDDPTGTGNTERIAVGDFKFGSSALSTVPEPSAVLLGLTGCLLLFRRARG